MAAASPALTTSRALLRALLVLNLAMGAFIVALMIASFTAEGPVMDALGVRPGAGRPAVVQALRLIMIAGLASVPLAFVVLTRLLAVVATVGSGDPFLAENGARLRTIGWALLGLELLNLAVGAIAASAATPDQPLDIGGDLSVTPWLAILLLFVLARVFEQGAAMRADLEGTV